MTTVGLVATYDANETQDVVNYLFEIEAKIKKLQPDMNLYLKRLLAYEDSITSVCYSYYSSYEQKIIYALEKLNQWNNYKDTPDAD